MKIKTALDGYKAERRKKPEVTEAPIKEVKKAPVVKKVKKAKKQ